MEGLLAIAVILVVIFAVAAAKAARRQQEQERLARERKERDRVEACGEVVLFFANHLGYIARSAISRQEIERFIDSGSTAPELASEICSRIDATPGIILGYHPIAEGQFEVKLPDEARERHLYIIGKSGSGKTNLLRNLILQDLEEGKGIGVIAPEQEMLTEEILPYIPDYRADDVIYFNPADSDRPVSFNPLELDEGEDKDLKVDECLTIFCRVFGEIGPRMEEILRQSLYALVGREGATLFDIARLLDRTDPGFREEVIRDTQDPEVAHFFREVYPSLPKDAHLPITTRLGRLLRPKTVRATLCNPHRSLNFKRAMDEGRVMLFNLSDGILGGQNSQLLGQLIVSKFQLAVMARAAQAKHHRQPFHLYIDEFQTFVGTSATSYEKILSRARKYRLSLTLAHQQTGQLPTQLLKEILGNVSTTVCFHVSREDAAKFSKEFVTTYNGEVIKVPEEEFLRLKVGQAWCKIGQSAFLLQTYLADQHHDHRRAAAIIERSRRNFGAPADFNASPPGFRAQQEAAETAKDQQGQQARKSGRPSAVDEFLKDIDPSNVFGE